MAWEIIELDNEEHKAYQDLIAVQSQFVNLNEDLEVVREKRKSLITTCLNNGYSVKKISTVLGLSRQRIYKIIESR